MYKKILYFCLIINVLYVMWMLFVKYFFDYLVIEVFNKLWWNGWCMFRIIYIDVIVYYNLWKYVFVLMLKIFINYI